MIPSQIFTNFFWVTHNVIMIDQFFLNDTNKVKILHQNHIHLLCGCHFYSYQYFLWPRVPSLEIWCRFKLRERIQFCFCRHLNCKLRRAIFFAASLCHSFLYFEWKNPFYFNECNTMRKLMWNARICVFKNCLLIFK